MKSCLKYILAAALSSIISFNLSSCKSSDMETARHNSVSIEKQRIGLSGVANARQLGGYVTKDGRTVKKNLLLRTAALNKATEEDIRILREKYRLRSIVDFRSDMEHDSGLDKEIPGSTNHHIPVFKVIPGPNLTAEDYRKIKALSGLDQLHFISKSMNMYDNLYSLFITNGESWRAYRKFFDVLLSDEDGAVLWHCSQGKDRAGFGAILVLLALGVDEETALADFELSNESYRELNEQAKARAEKENWSEQELEATLAMTGVSREFMEKTLALMKSECGSFDNYIRERIGLTSEEIQRLREKYLE